jgi:group I intron endonuclease
MTSGIYQIRNATNEKIYIGSAVNITARWNKHLVNLRKTKHHNLYLQNAYNKYGEENFEFSILEYCEKEYLIEREQYYLDTLCPEYNICKKAYSCLGIKHTEEEREKMRIARKTRIISPETCAKISRSNTGKVHSLEAREKMSKARI